MGNRESSSISRAAAPQGRRSSQDQAVAAGRIACHAIQQRPRGHPQDEDRQERARTRAEMAVAEIAAGQVADKVALALKPRPISTTPTKSTAQLSAKADAPAAIP